MTTSLSKFEVVYRHKALHRSLDELLACFYTETGKLAGKTSLLIFLQWSSAMKDAPTCIDKHGSGAARLDRPREWWIDLDGAPGLCYKITSDPITQIPPSPGSIKVREVKT